MREKNYAPTEVIFREGEPADKVYVVVNGKVELIKQSADGPLVLTIVGPLEMFGEMPPLDDTTRHVTARAVEQCRVKVIKKAEFRNWLVDEPEAAVRVVNTLIDRLRIADEAVIRLATSPQPLRQEARPPAGLLGAVVGLYHRLRGQAPTLALGGPGQGFQIGFATLNNDIDEAWTRALIGVLEGRTGVAPRVLPVSIQIEPGADQLQALTAQARARQVLASEPSLDLVVWGDVHEEGFSLWFTPAGMVDDDRPGSFGPFISLELAADLEPPVGDLLNLALVAAVEPQTEAQKALQRQLLPLALQTMPAMPAGLSVSWNFEQQRTALVCYAHAMALAAGWDADGGSLYDRAAEAYRAAILRLQHLGRSGVDEAVVRRHLGAVLMATGDRRQDGAILTQAVAELRKAGECLFKASYPQEWALAQNRLGLALYKLDLLTGQPDLLKDAMSAFQAAQTVFTRLESPGRWADVMNNLAQALQVYGDQVKSPEILARAVEACRSSLEIRSRERTPLAWASCQNTLGTALFLLDKHNQSTEHLDEALAAYQAAVEIYRSLGAIRQAAVTEKNIKHAEKLTKIRTERKVVLHDWAQE